MKKPFLLLLPIVMAVIVSGCTTTGTNNNQLPPVTEPQSNDNGLKFTNSNMELLSVGYLNQGTATSACFTYKTCTSEPYDSRCYRDWQSGIMQPAGAAIRIKNYPTEAFNYFKGEDTISCYILDGEKKWHAEAQLKLENKIYTNMAFVDTEEITPVGQLPAEFTTDLTKAREIMVCCETSYYTSCQSKILGTYCSL